MQGMTQLFHSRTRFLLIFICIGGTTPLDWGMASVSTLRTFAHKMVLVHCHCNLQSRNYKKNFMDVGFAVPSVLAPCQKVWNPYLLAMGLRLQTKVWCKESDSKSRTGASVSVEINKRKTDFHSSDKAKKFFLPPPLNSHSKDAGDGKRIW